MKTRLHPRTWFSPRTATPARRVRSSRDSIIEPLEARIAPAAFTAISNPDATYQAGTTKVVFAVPDGTALTSITDGTETVGFSTVMTKATVPGGGWSTWNSSPNAESNTPQVLFNSTTQTETITLSVPTKTFGVEVEPDGGGSGSVSADFFNGATLLGTVTRTANSTSGSMLFAATTDQTFTSVVVHEGSPQTGIGFAQFRYALAPLVVTGTVGNDSLVITATSSNAGTYQLTTDGVAGPVVPFSASAFIFNGLDGNDTFIIKNPAGSIFAPARGISYNGGTGHNVLQDLGGAANGGTYNVGPTADAGTLAHTVTAPALTQTIQFSGLAPTLDTVAGPLVVNATNAANAISYTQGSSAANGLVAIDGFEVLEFSSKTTLTLNGLGGDDTISLNNPTTPTALTGITVNGGDPTGSDTVIFSGIAGTSEIVSFRPTAQGAGTISEVGRPDVTLSKVEHLTLSVQVADNDGVDFLNTTGHDRIEYTPGATPDTATVVGSMDSGNATGSGPFAMIPVNLTGLSQSGLGNSGVSLNGNLGGADTIVLHGTAGNEVFNFAGATSLTTSVNAQQTSLIFFTNANTAALILDGGDGSDSFAITPSLAQTVTVLGGGTPNGSDTLTFSAPSVAITVDLAAATVSAAGFGAVGFGGIAAADVTGTDGVANAFAVSNYGAVSGLSTLNLSGGDTNNNDGDTIDITTTGGPDTLRYTPFSSTTARVERLEGGPVINVTGFNNADNGLSLDASGNLDAVQLVGPVGNDLIGVIQGGLGTRVTVTANGNPTGGVKWVPLDFTSVNALNIDGGAGNDRIDVDNSAGLVALASGITVDGSTGADSLRLIGTTAVTSDIYSVGPEAGAGSDVQMAAGVTQSVFFKGLEPVVDLVGGPLAVNGTNAANAIDYTQGSVATNGLVSIDGFEAIEFSNKTALTINALGGGDTINIDNPNTPTGLTGVITVNAGTPTAGDELIVNAEPGVFDPMVLVPTGTGAGTVVYAANNLPDVTFTGVEHLTLVGQEADGDAFGVDGTIGDDQLHFIPGATPDTGTIVGSLDQFGDTPAGPFALVPVSFTGMSQASLLIYNDFGQGGGNDSFIYDGTSAADFVTVTAPGPAGSLLITNLVEGVLFSALAVSNVTSASIHTFEGDDTVVVDGGLDVALTVDGGNPSASDTLAFFGTGGNVTVDLGAGTVQEVGFSAIDFLGIEHASVDADTGDLKIIGTASADVATVAPGLGSQTLHDEAPHFTLDTINSGALDVNLAAGLDSLTLAGTTGADTFTFAGTNTTAGTVTLTGFPAITYSGTERTILDGLAGDDLFQIASAKGRVQLIGGEDSDTVDFSGAATGVVFYLDAVGVDQHVNTTGEIVNLGDVLENFTGTSFNDILHVQASTSTRALDGGPHTTLPPGDTLLFDAQGAVVNVQKSDFNTGTIKTNGFADVTFDEFETVTLNNTPSSGSFGPPGSGSNAFTTANIYDDTLFKIGGKPAPGRAPTAVATGDLNGDGFADMVVVNTATKNLSILLNKGDGTFFNPVNIPSGGTSPQDIVIGNFTGDTNLDLVVSNPGSGNIAFFKGHGDGTFDAPAITLTPKFKPYALAAADLNGGGLDLVATSRATSAVEVLLGNGAGVFTPGTPVKAGGKQPVDVVLADFNADGKLDVATANNGSNNISFFAGNGAGALATAVNFGAGTRPTGLAVGDLNNDGRLDLAVSNQLSRFVSVLLGVGGAGGAQFQPQLRVAVPGSHLSSSIVIADFNGDGIGDLGLGNTVGTNFTILLGSGLATYTQPYEFNLGKFENRAVTGGIATADLNNDGQLDIIATSTKSDDVRVLLRRS